MAQGTSARRGRGAAATPAAETAVEQPTEVRSEEVGAVVTEDGTEHVGELPASAAAEGAEVSDGEVVNPLPASGDHDRIAMLSVRADGTADQHNPEFVVDADVAVAATRKQFAEQAVSAADAQLASTLVGPNVTVIGMPEGEPDKVIPLTTDAVGQDPSIAAAEKAHLAAQKGAIAAADAAVAELSKDS